MRALTAVDFGVCTFGVVGTLLFIGVFGEVAGLLKLVWGLASVGICLFTAIGLVANMFRKSLHDLQIRASLFCLCFNIVPGILFLIWHTGKTQIPTPPGCC